MVERPPPITRLAEGCGCEYHIGFDFAFNLLTRLTVESHVGRVYVYSFCFACRSIVVLLLNDVEARGVEFVFFGGVGVESWHGGPSGRYILFFLSERLNNVVIRGLWSPGRFGNEVV
jgi:hypothetical protein